MWTETKRGLHKQFTFKNFEHAWAFMERSTKVFRAFNVLPRWENDNNIVDVWLPHSTEVSQGSAASSSSLADAIDAASVSGQSETVDTTVVSKATELTEIKLYADGGSRGNPGPSASGFVVLDMAENILYETGIYLGITTNNQAEYQALKLGLEYILKTYAPKTVHVYMDSLLVVNQMKGIFKVRNRDLWPVHDAVVSILSKFEKIDFQHVPRELNKRADAAVNKCLDAGQDR